MAKETVGLKLDKEVADKFREIQKEYGSAQEFIETLLSVLQENKLETDDSSPVHKEKVKVKKALTDVERVVAGFLEIAANDKIKAEEAAAQQVTIMRGELTELKEKSSEQEQIIAELTEDNEEKKQIIINQQEAAENIQALKDAWENEKTNLTIRIAELDAEAKESRTLKIQVGKLEKALVEKDKEAADSQKQLELLIQQQKNDAFMLDELSGQVKEHKEVRAEQKQELKKLRTEIKDIQEKLSAEKLQAKEKELNLQKEFSSAKEKLISRVGELEKDHVEKKQFQDKIAELEKELTKSQESPPELSV